MEKLRVLVSYYETDASFVEAAALNLSISDPLGVLETGPS